MANELRFDGKVAIVTGAGNGLGRSHALLLASRGAKVVVNDLGGGATGGGSGTLAADGVVAEIEASGGEAVPSYDSVEHGDRIVKTAIERFGRLDIVVNNAGILRDKSFHKMSEEDWELVQRVHLLGSFRVTHAAWPHLREQGYGRIIMTASAAGIYGNFGQANYAAAKLGLVGLASSLAIEGGRRNIYVNTVAPIAGSRLTETVLAKDLVDALKPEYVSPLVAYLCHESCEENGGLFEVGGGLFAKLRWERSVGKTFRIGRTLTPEAVRASWPKISGFEKTTHPTGVNEALQPVMANIQAGPGGGGNELIDVDEALGYEFPVRTSTYDERDVAIYALGVGAALDPTDDAQLQLVYEMHQKGLRVLPTFGVIPALNTMLAFAKEGVSAPGLNYGLDRLLHGEQYTEVRRPLPVKAKLTHKAKIVDIFDKGKNAVVVTETRSFDEQGEELIVNRLTAVIRGAGGWGGDRGPSGEESAPPERDPDAVTRERIPQNQALLYRLSGDWNPLHADPGMAAAFGFDRPILHGLCTFGYAARHVIDAFSGGDPRYFKSIKVRFAQSVYPGETLLTEMWKESDTRIVFRCKVKERDVEVITRAAIELYPEVPKPKPQARRAAEPAAATAAAAPSGPTGADVFAAIDRHLTAHKELIGSVGAVFRFEIHDPTSTWTVDVKQSGAVTSGDGGPKPDCTLAMSEADLVAMCTGKADPQKLYFGGKLKISGNIMASQKLTFLKKLDVEAGGAAVAGAPASGAPSGDEASASGAPSGAEAPASGAPSGAEALFASLASRLADSPELAAEIGAVVRFRIEPEGRSWVVDPKQGVTGARDVKAAATLTLSAEDLAGLADGTASARDLFQRGRLRVDGDIRVAHRLAFLRETAQV